ncbi:MAG: hypothetical protein RBJ76_18460 [Stenomitos frigidus ULC029]
MDTLHYEDEVFETLYNISVGIERLFKVAIILVEHEDNIDQNKFEKSLITHSHQGLLERLKKGKSFNLSGVHNEFLSMLSTFYKTHRYGRYSTSELATDSKESDALQTYIKKYLGITITDDPPFNLAPNSQRIRKFIGKVVGKISTLLYEIICEESRRRNIYTYEIRSDSKAGKIFLSNEYDFANEDVLWRELIVYFINAQESSENLKFAREIEPLKFDPELTVNYLKCFGSTEKMLLCLDELEELYSGVDAPGERLEWISLLGKSGLDFAAEDEYNEA